MEHTITGMDRQTYESLNHIAQSLQSAGYDPYEQIVGYLKTGDITYITRKGDARTLIQRISIGKVQQYADSLLRSNRI